ncbi:MAG: DeoR/GlpR transcriptional regulator [Mesorhizobium sp.]|nr:MAG: DeoR/GlpR transcriptional regulator [Mesorhizobium sp.]RWO07482.1 MAG: DeoR/GlpR transcriptional regulator [Mesorhizobium sp.]TIP39564.1 MAG: DeoR/GlpR transcriptional regulator [Mesorhizobium sp.]TIQ06349.1 MAG: DeoR/GlpR transcriptional regulator [Mesorhizobium sp.]TJV28271.1 MAG: DeoR/GlpR transcriptional regulator [Mesorhizobium sp.]
MRRPQHNTNTAAIDHLTRAPTELSATRHRRIVELLAETAELHVDDLSRIFAVSPETIRRDLRLLEQKGALRRVHGGAVLCQEILVQSYQQRMALLTPVKEVIPEQILQLSVHAEGQTIFIGGGSTMLALAKRMSDRDSAIFVTNGINVAVTLKRSGVHSVVLTGGQVHGGHELLTGNHVLETVRRFNFDVAYIDADALDADLGLLDRLESESLLHRLIARHSRRYVVAIDHAKFEASAPFASVPLPEIDVLVTDREPSEVVKNGLQLAGVRLVHPDSLNGPPCRAK